MGRFHKRWALLAVLAMLLLVSPAVVLAEDVVDVSVSLGHVSQELIQNTDPTAPVMCEVSASVTISGTATSWAAWYLSRSGNVPGTWNPDGTVTFDLLKGSDGVIVVSVLAADDVNLRNNFDRQRVVVNCR